MIFSKLFLICTFFLICEDPPCGLDAVKIQCLFRGEEGEGGEVGAGAASDWGERKRKREPGKKYEDKNQEKSHILSKKNNVATSQKFYRSF